MTDWDRRFLDLATHVSTWSKDPSTKVGSVIVDRNRRVVSVGYNGFPRGILDSNIRLYTKELKHLYITHAEINALSNTNSPVEGCTLYCTLLPCSECAKSIIQAGIRRVVTYNLDRFDSRFNFDTTQEMFIETNIILDCLAK